MEISGKNVIVHTSDVNGAPLVIVNTVHGEGEDVYSTVRSIVNSDFSYAAIAVPNWNDDMTPWPAPAIFPNGQPFGGHADSYLKDITDDILPKIIDTIGYRPDRIVLAGYSLAGLFSLYSAYRTDVFSDIVSASGSFWYPGFIDFVDNNDMIMVPDSVYLSLGDREPRTRNMVMRRVGENTKHVFNLLGTKCSNIHFSWNPGNHFDNHIERLASGITWTIHPSKNM